MGALDIARAFGLHEVDLPDPPGFQAKIRMPSMPELMRKGVMPTDLRRALLNAEKTNGDGETLSDDQVDVGIDTSNLRAARMVRAVRIDDGDWETVSLSIDDFLALPESTQEALLWIVTGQRTPAMVTALVRRSRGQITDAEAAQVIEEETPKLVSAWASFRNDGGGAAPGDHGVVVSEEPVGMDPGSGSDGGVRAGRGADDPRHDVEG